MFDFNASLNDAAPMAPIPLPVYLTRIGQFGLFMDVICVLFLSYSLLRLSSVSVVFDLNEPLNDVAPVSPM